MQELLSTRTSGRAADLIGNYVTVSRPSREDRPWVLINFVASPDGSVATGGRVGGLSSPVDKEVFRLLRSVADVILVGAGTVRAEGYGPHRPSAEHQASRRERGQPASATMAVVSASLRLNLQSALFSDGARPIVITPNNVEAAARDRTAAHADLIMAGEDAVDLQGALRQLHGRGVRLVVCEGGPLLFAKLLAGGLVDELCLTVSPLLVADPVRLLPAGALAQPAALRLAHVLEDDGHLFLRYLLASSDRGDR
ncbi:pyrimidine reductase family protein [Pseudonocardia bannensis]|uniref:Pyrimidine reductase family protein n=2 Tax=Pseudonocardia bannensis TaxID=630973 RepID=A0A848DQQ0_9PSEU|nr:pyrimidine reductase family protein [Pseudonocardia bannensis]